MKCNYIINSGRFINQEDRLCFQGEEIEVPNPATGLNNKVVTNGEILFGDIFQEGTISFEVEFDEICDQTRTGIILNYKNINGQISFYQIGIRNMFSGYSIDYYNGKSWEFRAFGGQPNFIQSKSKYSIEVKLLGSNVQLCVNGVKLLEYTNFADAVMGPCGVYINNNSKVIISNIAIDPQKPSVFCVMKFERDFDDLYQDVIKPQCELLGLRPIRADECYTSSAIIHDILREIANALIIITDVTMDNPNVFYELGYAHALQKPTILLADVNKRDRLPFDISGYRTIFYSNTIAGKKLKLIYVNIWKIFLNPIWA